MPVFLTIDPIAFTIGPLTVRWYGVVISLCLLLAVLLCIREAKRQQLSEDYILDIFLLALPLAILGARFWYVIFHWDMYKGSSLLDLVAIWRGGSAIQGGLIVAFLVIYLYCRHKGLRFLQMMDIISLGLILGQSLGRWANFFNAEAYGPVIEEGSFWSWVPFKVWAEGAWHHPTFLYEFLWDLLAFVVLWLIMRRLHRYGGIFAGYLILYCLGRALIEPLRQDKLLAGGVPVTMIVCAVGIAAGVLLLLAIRKQPRVDVADPFRPAPRRR